MKLTKFDIGAEIISIITRGMYPDPKDALREYIQNGVDAASKNIIIKIRQETIVIEDDGIGMNNDILRKAIRVGISDKNPSRDVGFMGIGIYSAFHLCDKLTIFSRGSRNIPNKLQIDFGSMKTILEEQKEKRLNNEIDSDQLVDLQTLLENCITLSEDGETKNNEYPSKGTRVELTKIESEFYSALSEFDEVAEYLRNVIPLKFDNINFSYAEEIEKEISRICEEKKQKFEIINLTLQVNTKKETLFRPYRDSEFNDLKPPFPPTYFIIQSDGDFFGVAWGCLNSVRKILFKEELRGFILKKQGFSIGKRENLVKYFPKGQAYFERYSGEIILVNPKILPNASRSDIEYSPIRTKFYDSLKEIAEKFDEKGELFQETDKANVELSKLHSILKKEIGGYNEYEENAEILVDKIVRIKGIQEKLKKRIKNKNVDEEIIDKAKLLLNEANEFEQTIQQRIKNLTENKKTKSSTKTKNEIAKELSEIKVDEKIEEKNYESLFELLKDLDYKIDEELKKVIYIIDEQFIQRLSKNKTDYYQLLNSIKESLQND